MALTDTGNPSLSAKTALPAYKNVELTDEQNCFIENYAVRTKSKTKLGYLEAYMRYGLPSGSDNILTLHSNLKPCGTKTLRWASTNPNQQQIDKWLRYGFCPREGYEYWALDYNLSLIHI